MKVAIPAGWGISAGIDAERWPGLLVRRYDRDDLRSGVPPALSDVEGLVPTYPAPPEAVLRLFQKLKVISLPSTGVLDYVDLAAAGRLGIAVCNVRDYGGDAIAEYTIGLMVAIRRRIVEADRSMRAGEWSPTDFRGTELRGATLGILGFGSIGSRVAALAQHLGMRVLVFTPHPPVAEVAPGISFVSFEEVLARADVLSLHASLTAETTRMLGRSEFGRLKRNATVVNTARGALLDMESLLEALRSGHLGGAALDVFDPEPLPTEHPLRTLPNVVLTPHIAASTAAVEANAIRMCLENLVAFGSGRPINLVNADVTAGS